MVGIFATNIQQIQYHAIHATIFLKNILRKQVREAFCPLRLLYYIEYITNKVTQKMANEPLLNKFGHIGVRR